MSQPPTGSIGWNEAGWPPDERGEPGASGRAPGKRQAAGWSAVNGQPPQAPRVYGRATPGPTYGQPAPPPTNDEQPPTRSYGPPPTGGSYGPPPTGLYGQQRPTRQYGQPSYGQPSYRQPTPYEPPTPAPMAYPGTTPDSGHRSGILQKLPGARTLALVAAALLLLAGIMTALYFTTSNELSRAEKNLATNIQQVEQLNRDVKAANDRVAKAQQDLAGTKNSRNELQRQKDVIARCLNLLAQAGQAASRGDRSEYEDAIEKAQPVCREADRYL
jgi:hypothetical protein